MLRRAAAWLLLFVAAPAAAQEYPAFTGLVVDAADVLPPADEARLKAELEALQRDTGRQLVVATVADLQGYPIADYGNGLIRHWQVGLADVDNGAILLVAPKDRKVRVEVGYGLEPILTDAFASVTIRETILPRFRAGDLPGGVTAGAAALVAQLRAAPEEASARAAAAEAKFDREQPRTGGAPRGGDDGVPVALIFWGVVLLFFILPLFARGPRGRRWGGGGSNWPIVLWAIGNELSRGSRGGGWGGGWGSGGGGGGWRGGGFTGGGGGSGGGGGASGSW